MSDEGNDSSNGSPINIFAILLLILSATGMFLEPLISPRPDEPGFNNSKQEKSAELIETRLWFDPIDFFNKQPNLEPSTHTNTLREELKEFYRYRNFSVVAISVSGSSYYEIAETRRRNRVAVVSAFNSEKYYPGDGERLGYYNYKAKECIGKEDWLIPYEWFDKEEEKTSNILVLWLDESKIKKSKINYRDFVDCLAKEINSEWQGVWKEMDAYSFAFRDPNEPVFQLIGPSGAALMVDLLRSDPIEYSKLRVFAHSVTTPTKKIIESLRANCLSYSTEWYCSITDEKLKKESEEYFVNELEDTLKKHKIIRTIGTDDKLVSALLWELWNRGINNFRSILPFSHVEIGSECLDGLVIITELDTLYARSLGNHLEADKFWKRCKNPPVKKLVYFRGVDGKLPSASDRTEKNQDKQPQKKDKSGSLKQWDDAPPEHAEGRNQYDYLRRLADTIEELDRDTSFAKNGVKAIGILGSDVYDKLVILHALRERFREKIFFTTDLDARYLHADQLKWTRNLVVASNFDLSIRSDWQNESMPFRDGYQTSIYYSVLLALRDIDEYSDFRREKNWVETILGISKSQKPQLFEIGRTKALSLNSPSVNALNEWDLSRPALAEKKYSIGECKKGRNGDSESRATCLQTVPERSLQKTTREEIVLNTIFIIVGCIVIFIGYSLLLFKMKLSPKNYNLMSMFWKSESRFVGICILIFIFAILGFEFISEDVYEPFIWSEGISVWPNLIIRFVGIFLIFIFFCSFYKKLRERKKEIDPYFLQSSCKTQVKNDICGYWKEYCRNTHDTKFWIGLGIATLIAVILTLSFVLLDYFHSFGTLNFPYRGEFAHNFHIGLLIFQFIVLWGLVFWVAFEAKACNIFISKVCESENTEHLNELWSSRILEREVKETGVSKMHMNRYMTFLIVVKITENINHLVYLPLAMVLTILVGRSRIFDQFGIPLSLIIVFSIAIIYLFVVFYYFRQSSENLRSDFLAGYESQQINMRISERRGDDIQIERLINRIRNESNGIYAKFGHQPAFTALLIPFGGMSGVQIVEYLFNI